MKTKYIFLSIFMLGCATAEAQTISFDNADDFVSVGVYDTWELSPFRTGAIAQPNRYAAVVDNPQAGVDELLGEAPNPTPKVVAVQRSRFGSNTFGARIDLKTPFALGEQTKYVHVLVYKPEGETGPLLLTALGKRTDWPFQSKEAEQLWVKSNSEIIGGRWNDVVFAISTNPNVEIHSLVVAPDLASPHNRTEDFVAYIDEIEINDNALPRFALTNYPVNFDLTQKPTRTDRKLTQLMLSGSTDGRQVLAVGTSTVYRDQTEKRQLTAKAGDELTVKLTQSGVWMSGYVYVDWDNDGKFEPIIEDNLPAEGSELVSYTHLSGYDSKGKANNGNNVSGGSIVCPSFVVPENTPAGVYRMRCKVDWDCEDPGGNVSSNNHIVANGGGIVDMLLNIHDDEVKISANQLNGDVLNTDSTTLTTSPIPFGKAYPVLMSPAPGFTYKGIVVKHGYNLDGEQYVRDNRQWTVDSIPASDFKEDTYTLPATTINGEVRIEGLFDINTGIGAVLPDQTHDAAVLSDEPMYDLSGRRVGTNARGIIVQSGRKLLK